MRFAFEKREADQRRDETLLAADKRIEL